MDPACCDSDEQLDLEYLKILRLMKPYITCIMNNHYVELIRVWLEKLSSRELSNKIERNKYLAQLGKQIEEGILDAPFLDPPPDGALQPFDDVFSNENNSQEDNLTNSPNLTTDFAASRERPIRRETFRSNVEVKSNKRLPNIEEDYQDKCNVIKEKINRVQQFSKDIQNSLKPSARKPRKKRMYVTKMAENEKYYTSHQEPLPIAQLENYNQAMIEKYNNTKQQLTDDSSWLDVTDVSTTNFTVWGSGDAELSDNNYENNRLKDFYDIKVSNLLNIIEELKEENLILKQDIQDRETELQLRNSKAEDSINGLTNEVDSLKTRLQELVDIKLALQSSHYAVATEWQVTVHSLEKRLHAVQRENEEFKTNVSALEKKLNAAISSKSKKTLAIRKKMCEMHDKEIAILKQLHNKTIAHIEGRQQQLINDKEEELNRKVKELRDAHEHKLADQKFEHEKNVHCLNVKKEELGSLVQELNEKILKMQDEMQETRTHLENVENSNVENQSEKICFLQKCILKLEKLYHKSEKEYAKQIAKLKREIEIKDRAAQVQLTTQKAELISQSNNERQAEVDKVINKLEEHYRALLQTHQLEAITRRQEDEKVISELRQELDRYKIGF